ncbi:hypothetical protein BU24DRAFT_93162 [Aaosphaeria arxii CBS 175.79]|uniref:Zn(2)-C6 fungal-type domain-containing protein n=1 Tax=Aaosphaeria arxii CBS 175.79 TaxID=1450172 RepID=A0A6A5X6C3_9PLEO|nr:uncharacterized protein BU24DRAFT_93162 [Aaosphaeria arxii CBS 175.79]KAF2008565.1 hypothetical protein BU24DRAFT_93162 [Aaosphaeria arxii CBS 175.79]
MTEHPSSPPTILQATTPRIRASKACRRCHDKRVKCDASERGTPCTRCEQRREPECTLIQSRRGIYPRKARRQIQRSTLDKSHNTATIGCDPNTAPTTTTSARDTNAASNTEPLRMPVVVPDSADITTPRTTVEPAASSPHATHTNQSTSYREVSWATTFNHLLECHHSGGDVLNKHSITYIGEASPLDIVLKDLRRGTGRPQLHHPAPPFASEEVADSPRVSHPAGMQPEEIAFLEAKEAFTAPPNQTMDALMDIFFERVFPLYPIVNPQELLRQHKAHQIPWMLLHALCFISATYCPMQILRRAGFDSRLEARSLFHGKTKALFDIGYEGNKIVALQVCILMSFWGGGPSNYWNFYTWICTGVTIAETLGFHRSMAGAMIEPQDRSLIKRLWWVLVIRDATCASLVGRPFRINLDHCDVDPLTEEDLRYDGSSTEFLQSPHVQCSGLYQIHATRLSLILRHIITTRFYPRKQFATESLQQMLLDWRNDLPAELRWSDFASNHLNVFASTLCILYNHNIILAHVNGPTDSAPNDPEGATSHTFFGEEVASDAAQQIASSACSVVTDPNALLPPHELFHGLFIASVVFYMQTKSDNRSTARLGMSGLTNCKMALHATRETWDASPWISQLFDKILCISTANRRTNTENLGNDTDTRAEIDPSIGSLDLNGFPLPEPNEWPSQLFLGNIFDIPSNSTFSMPYPFAAMM